MITSTNVYGSQDPWVRPVLPWLLGAPVNLTGWIFTTGTGLLASIFSFVNRTTDRWSAISFTITECSANDTSVNSFYTSFSLHSSVALFYRDIISHFHIILSGQGQITNSYWNSSALHLRNTLGTFSSDSNNFYCPLQYDTTVNSDLHKNFITFPMSHLTVSDSP